MLKPDLLMECFLDQRGEFPARALALQRFCRRAVKGDWAEQRDSSQLSGNLYNRRMVSITL